MPLSSVVGAQSLVRPGVCTSSTRPASPFEGQTIYETDTDLVKSWDGSSWITIGPTTEVGKVLQVVSTTKTDTYSNASSTFTDVTGLTVSITPSATLSKILVFATIMVVGESGVTAVYMRLARGGTGIAVGGTAGSRVSSSSFSGAGVMNSMSASTLDSPSTTSSTTYSVQLRNQGSGTIYINRTQTDADAVVNSGRFASSITVMEISA